MQDSICEACPKSNAANLYGQIRIWVAAAWLRVERGCNSHATALSDDYRLGAGITKSTTVRDCLKPSRFLSLVETTTGGSHSFCVAAKR